MRVRGASAVLAAAVLLTACGTGTDQPAASSSAPSATPALPSPPASSAPTSVGPTASPADTATPDPSTSATATRPIAPLTDYGAVLSVWASRHVADERFDPGAMWDATTGWGPDEDNNDRFNNVVVTGGRVLDYTMYLPRGGATAARATALALAALPKDAAVLWKEQFAACSVVQLSSASLAKVVAGKPFANPQGQIELVLGSGAPNGLSPVPHYDPAKVTRVLVRPKVAATAADFTGC